MKNLFISKLSVKIGFDLLKKSASKWVAVSILGGPIGYVLSYFAEKFIDMLVEKAVLVIDLGNIGLKITKEKKEYLKFVSDAYIKAKKKVYSESEKEKIRADYLEAIHKFGSFDGKL